MEPNKTKKKAGNKKNKMIAMILKVGRRTRGTDWDFREDFWVRFWW